MTRSNAAETLKEFCVEKATDITVIMGLHIVGDLIQRDLAVFHLSKPEVAHEVCIGLFIMLAFYQELLLVISPQSGMGDDSEIVTIFLSVVLHCYDTQKGREVRASSS